MTRRMPGSVLLAAALAIAGASISAAQQSPLPGTSTGAVVIQPPSAAPAPAGGPEGSVFVAGLLSYQPANTYYVGFPYLDAGLAGVGPGLAAGFQAAGRSGLIGSFEFSTGRIQSTLSGRLVGREPVEVSVADTLLSVLAGYRVRAGNADVRVVGGPSLSFRAESFPAVFGINDTDGSPSILAVTGGVDVAQMMNPRVSIVETFRYSYVSRSDKERQLGLGSHILRFGVGVRYRLDGP